MTDNALLALAGIGLVGVGCQWLAWWAKLPAILFLLLAGIAAGPVTGLLAPDALFGDLLFPMVSLSVAVILFEGSLTLRIKDIRGLGRVVRNLVTIGAGLTWLVIALATRVLFEFPWGLAFLFGALVVVTGPTVIVPMLRTVRPAPEIANILRWEGIVIDPLGAVMALLVFDFIISDTGDALAGVLLDFAAIVLVGVLVGLVAAQALGLLMRRHWLPEYLHNVFTLTLVFGVFAGADTLQHESGLLAVTVMGMRLANMNDVNIEQILDFKESLSMLLISGLFIVLAARLEADQFRQLGWPAAALLAVIMLVARPLSVLASTAGSGLDPRHKALLAWIAPRGIVAAAVSALFALRLDAAGYAEADMLVTLTFLVIIGTVVIQSVTAGWIARTLGVAEPEPRGVLVAGANVVARTVAAALKEQGYEVLLTDSSWENVSAARMQGLATFFGNPVSQYADRHLDLLGMGRLLALSARPDFNALACLRFRPEFGGKAVYELQSRPEKAGDEKHEVSVRHRGYKLFGNDVTYPKLASLMAQGAEIHSTTLSEAFDFSAYRAQYGARVIPMFALDKGGRLHVFVADGVLAPEPGWKVLGLIVPEPEAERGGDEVPAPGVDSA